MLRITRHRASWDVFASPRSLQATTEFAEACLLFPIPRRFLSWHFRTIMYNWRAISSGVNSGLVVNTTCTWDDSKPEPWTIPENLFSLRPVLHVRQMYLLHCPDAGAFKNWISQGLSAATTSGLASDLQNFLRSLVDNQGLDGGYCELDCQRLAGSSCMMRGVLRRLFHR